MELDSFERLATLRPLPLAGGDLATREIWRLALAALDDAFDGSAPLDSLPVFSSVRSDRVDLVRRMIASGLNAPPAHGLGRWFDAIGALVLAAPVSRHEGEVALRWNLVATKTDARPYAFAIERTCVPWQIDLRPLVRDVVRDLANRRPAGVISARFHATVVEAAARVVETLLPRASRLPVVLSGGCFQNALLAEGLQRRLSPPFDVVLPRAVPAGDGGLALGQAVVADAITRRSPCV